MDNSLFSIESSFLPDAQLNALANSQPLAIEERYILTEAGEQQWVFPSRWVAEILVIERTQMLALPCYGAAILGVVHHHGQIIPLVTPPVFGQQSRILKESLNVIRLNQTVSALEGVGIVVNRVISGCIRSDLPSTLFTNDAETSVSNGAVAADSPDSPSVQLFDPKLLPNSVWQPNY